MEKKIPTLAGIIFAVLLVGILAFLFQFFTATFSQASGSGEPNNVIFTNISDVTFTLTWTTANPANGFASITGSQKNKVVYDERDLSDKHLGLYTEHSVTATGLEPDTAYSVKIISGGKTFTNNGNPYTTHTGPLINSPAGGLKPAYGIVNLNSSPAGGGLVYLDLEGGQILSTLISKSGTWLIPLNLARTKTLTQYLKIQGDRLNENIRVVYNGKDSTAITDTLNDSPVPDMEIGKQYDFRRQQAKNPNQNLATNTISKSQVLGSETTRKPEVALVQPAEGAFLPTSLPLISGTGFAGKLVSIVIGITNPLAGTTTVSTDGTWQMTPSKPLDQGLQSVTITTVNDQNKPMAITHTFTILKSGTQVLGTATPSATLAPTLTPIITATPSTLTGQPVPTSGTTLPTLLILLFGLTLLGSGAVLVAK